VLEVGFKHTPLSLPVLKMFVPYYLVTSDISNNFRTNLVDVMSSKGNKKISTFIRQYHIYENA